MDAQISGNTKASICTSLRARAFQFTINDLSKFEPLKDILNDLTSLKYMIACKEIAPTTGKEHIHVYAHFSNAYKISKKILDLNIHIELCKGSPQQNIAYIRKEGNIIYEIGDEPHQGAHTVKQLKDIDNPDDLNWNEYNTWKKIKSEYNNDIDIDELYKNVTVFYIQGESGSGKTTKAKELARDYKYREGNGTVNFIKHDGNFWIGIGEKAEIAIYDDFRPSDMKVNEFINFIDYNIHVMNVKGGEKLNKYKLIIITSIVDLEDIYLNCNESQMQWIRRVNVIDLKGESNKGHEIN
nr:MAG: replication associated protein [ssDNA virus sp.]